MKTPVILLCVLLIAVLIVYSAAAGMDLDSLDEPSLSEDDFAIYLPLIVTEYQSGGNLSPYIPANPAPGNGDIDQGADVDLSWSGGDPDGDSVFYDVYFEANDSSPDNLWCEDIGGMICDPSTLQFNTTYYWQVIARDEHDATTTGPVWVFKTGAEPNDPPFEPNNPSPADGSSDQDMNSVLSWQGGDPDGDNVTYDVFFEVDDSSPDKLICDDLKSSICDPDTLENGASYYWQVVARDEHGVSSSSPVWTFKTENRPPTTPTNPTPADGAAGQSLYVNLSWSGGDPDGDHVMYDVYFEANDSSPDKLLCDDIGITFCDPGTLQNDTTYFWKVDVRDELGAVTTGLVWNFKTIPPPCVPTLLSPEQGAIMDNGRIDFQDLIIWDFDWGDCPGATKYHLYVKHPSALNPVIDVNTVDGSSYHHENVAYIANCNRFGWEWKVRSMVGGEWGPWSPVRSFDAEPVDSDPPMILGD